MEAPKKLTFTIEQIVGKDGRRNISTVGTGLQIEMPFLTHNRVKKIFGKLPYGVKNREYSEPIILTNNHEKHKARTGEDMFSTGIYTLYTFYGEWRIGGGNTQYEHQLSDMLHGIIEPSFEFKKDIFEDEIPYLSYQTKHALTKVEAEKAVKKCLTYARKNNKYVDYAIAIKELKEETPISELGLKYTETKIRKKVKTIILFYDAFVGGYGLLINPTKNGIWSDSLAVLKKKTKRFECNDAILDFFYSLP